MAQARSPPPMADLDLQVNFKVILLVVMTLWVEINPCLALHLAQARSSPSMAVGTTGHLRINVKVTITTMIHSKQFKPERSGSEAIQFLPSAMDLKNTSSLPVTLKAIFKFLRILQSMPRILFLALLKLERAVRTGIATRNCSTQEKA